MAPQAFPQRLLDACPSCARQYDVTHLSAGQGVRCECGASFAARHLLPRSPRALRCSACGANLREGARTCDFCRAEITLEERLLGSVCPACFARARVDARFCMECGGSIAPQALVAVPEHSRCPRCEGELRSRSLDTASVIECGECGGLWLEGGVLDAICRRAERELPVGPVGAPAPRRAVRDEARYLACPRCGDFMVRRNYAGRSGVVLDVCRPHGVWLDAGEMERVVDFIRAGGRAEPILADALGPRAGAIGTGPRGDGLPLEPARGGRGRRAWAFLVDVLETLFVRR